MISEVLRKYCSKLFGENINTTRIDGALLSIIKQPTILKVEVKRDVTKRNNNKTPVMERLTTDAKGETGIDLMHTIYQQIARRML